MAKSRKFKSNRGGEPTLIGNCLKPALDMLGVQEKFSASKLLIEWKNIVGESISANTKPVGVTGGVLTVHVSNSVWLMELSRFYKKDMLKKISGELNDSTIKDILFKVGEI